MTLGVDAALDSLPPLRGEMSSFVEQVGVARSRPILVRHLPAGLPTGSLCGAWLPRLEFDLIFLADDVSGELRDHTLAHELGHCLLGHVPDGFDELLAEVIDPAPMLARASFTDPQEVQAEEFAHRLLSRHRGSGRSVWSSSDRSARTAAVFGSLG